jgi:hypothetical protein
MKKPQSGYNTNLASEFYILSILYRLGLNANLTLGNKKAVDIVVVRDVGEAITIDVKAVAGKDDWLLGKPGLRPRPRHFVVLVTYDAEFQNPSQLPRVWIIPHAEFLHLVKFGSGMYFVSRKQVLSEAGAYENAWHLLSAQGQLTPAEIGPGE